MSALVQCRPAFAIYATSAGIDPSYVKSGCWLPIKNLRGRLTASQVRYNVGSDMMKLSTKLIGGFAVPMVILLVLSGVVVWRVHNVHSAADLAFNESFVNSQRGQELKLCVVHIQEALTDASLTGETDGIEEARQNQTTIQKNLAAVRSVERENSTAWVTEVKKIEEHVASFVAAGLKMVDAYVHQGKEQGNRAMETRWSFHRVPEQINRFATTQDEELKKSLASINDQAAALTCFHDRSGHCGASDHPGRVEGDSLAHAAHQGSCHAAV